MKGVHEFGLGPWPLSVILISDKRTYGRWARKFMNEPHTFPPMNGGLCAMLKSRDHGDRLLILVGEPSTRDELACTLAHEAVHARRFLFEHVGEAAPSKEAEAYLVDHIVRESLRLL